MRTLETNNQKIKGINTQKSLEKTADIMNLLFISPNPIVLILPILIISIITGVLIDLNADNLYNSIIINGILLLAIPTYISAIFSKIISESLGGIFYLRRSMLLSFICLVIICIILIIGKFVLMPFFSLTLTVLLIFSYATIFWIRHVVFLSIVLSTNVKALIPSLIQPVLGIVFLYYVYPFQINEWMFLFAVFIIFFISVYLFISLVNSPMKSNFGVNGIELLKYFFFHMTENKDFKEIEKFFLSFSESLNVPLDVIGFKTKQKIKALLIVPSVHPGPFGNLGGSNLPLKISEGLKDVAANILVPHGATNHDYNLAVSKDCDKLVAEAKRLINNLNYSSGCTPLIRCNDELDICAQMFGKSVLFTHTSAPNPTDDIDPTIGQMIVNEMKKEGFNEIVFLDAHNCLEKGAGCVFFNTRKAHKIFELSKKAANLVRKNRLSSVKMGFSQRKGFDIKEDGIGPLGIQVLTIESHGKKNSYILYDGNNMVKGLRENIIAEIKTMIDEVEILTTDNHVVNVQIGGYNPIGLKIDNNKLIQQTSELVKKSIDDLEECSVGVNSGLVEDVRLFGYGNTYRISTTINSIVSTLRLNTFTCLFFGFFLCFLIYIVIFK
jgi:putative membrane protein